MQLMPATAAKLGVRNVFDVRRNIEGGVRHLRRLLDRYGGNLALAAYNAGAEAVTRYGGIPPYAETQMYVARILRLLQRSGLPRAAEARVLHRYETADGRRWTGATATSGSAAEFRLGTGEALAKLTRDTVIA
jgi:hypothetical protein